MVTIRDARAADIPALIELARPVFEEHFPLTGSRATVQVTLANLRLAGGYLRLAEKDGRAVGFLAGLAAALRPWSLEKCAMELLFFVAPAHRGRAALMLLRDFEAWAEGEGCVSVAVTGQAAQDGERVGRFYERAGYAALETSYVRRLACG